MTLRTLVKRHGWIALAIVLLVVWSGGYMGVAALVEGRTFHSLLLEIDTKIPFIPSFSLVYLSVYLVYLLPFFYVKERKVNRELFTYIAFSYLTMLLVSYSIFVIFPVAYPRTDLVLDDSFGSWVLGIIHDNDPAWNCFPSTHCAASLLSALVLLEMRTALGVWAIFGSLAIGASTLFTKQHYIVDVLAGYLVALFTWFAYFKQKITHTLGANMRAFQTTIGQLTQETERAINRKMQDAIMKLIEPRIQEEIARRVEQALTERGLTPSAARAEAAGDEDGSSSA